MSDSRKTGVERQGQSPMTDELVALLRDRVASRYYDQPRVIDTIARAMLKSQDIAPST
jgi:hypothetical protein